MTYAAINGVIHHREKEGDRWLPTSNETAKRIVREWQEMQGEKS